ncbi:hypothetical protein PHET_06987 [Paragonimus heterotremus]|uniref:Bromo domain-containing protein n=1 Tax=Paragonimus heterotremus TaxID=100268 RepID=A0A8J4WG14_9TREM|nr:hypothetical protein PHET_06987 [Paragonimus heterotremus]
MAASRADIMEVQLGRELLEALLSRANSHLTYLFMDEIDPEALGLRDYRKVVKEPMWLNKMIEKFSDGTYHNIREFVCDFRLMLLNCYRYNGVSSRIGRLAEKLELLFEQKLQLMSPEIRSKTSIQATLGNGTAEDELADSNLPRRRSSSRLFLSGDSRQLTPMRAIAEELEHALQPDGSGVTGTLLTGLSDSSKYSFGTNAVPSGTLATAMNSEDRAAILVARLSQWRIRRQEEAFLNSWDTWWKDNHGVEIMDTLDHTPELLEIYQFLWLTDPFLGITDSLALCTASGVSGTFWNDATGTSSTRSLCLYDLELGLSVAPRASQLLAVCMSHLLATPKERGQIVAVLSSTFTNGATPGDSTHTDSQNRRQRTSDRNRTASLAPLEYDVWERRLSALVSSWYRAFWDKGKGRVLWAVRRLGLHPDFFRRCGSRSSPLESRRFHELPPYIRIQLFHALCENVLRTFDNLRVSLDRDADWEAARPVPLGNDLFSDFMYVHFPGLLDIEPSTASRIYRVRRVRRGPVDISGDAKLPSGDLKPEKSDSPTPSLVDDSVAKESVPADCSDLETPSEPPNLSSVAELLSERVLCRPRRRGQKQNSSVTKAKNPCPKLKVAMIKHDRMIAESGLPVPGPVVRLPCWLDSSLARSTCRRWYKIAEELHSSQLTSISGQASKLRKSTPQTWLEKFASHFNPPRRKKSQGPHQSSAPVPFSTFLRADNSKLKELVEEDPILNPSPFGLLNGLSRRYLSMQFGRGYYGQNRNKSRRRPTVDAGPDATQSADTVDEANEVASSNATSQCDADEIASCPSDSQSEDESQPLTAANRLVKIEDDTVDERLRLEKSSLKTKDGRRTWVEEGTHDCQKPLSSPPCSPLSNVIQSEQSEENPPHAMHVTREVSNIHLSSEDPIVSTEKESENTNTDANPPTDLSNEDLIKEPDRSLFALVARNPTEIQVLISQLRTVLKTARQKPDTVTFEANSSSQSSNEDSSSDDSDGVSTGPDSKRRRLDGSHKMTENESDPVDACSQKRSRRIRRAIRMLKELIFNLEQLRTLMLGRPNDWLDAQQLARLRLRKDVVALETKEKSRLLELSRQTSIDEESMTSESADARCDLAAERAERLKRREQLRVLGRLEDEFDQSGNSESLIKQADSVPLSHAVPSPSLSSLPPPDVSRVDKHGLSKVPAASCTSVPTTNTPAQSYKVGTCIPPQFSPQNYPGYSFSGTPVSNITSQSSSVCFKFNSLPVIRTVRPQSNLSPRPNGVSSPFFPVRFKPSVTVSQAQQSQVTESQQVVTPRSPTSTTPVPRKIYRVHDTLFTEDACPVRIDAGGVLISLPIDSVPAHHRQVARQMIARYKHFVQGSGLNSVPQPVAPSAKRVSVTTGEPDAT